MGRYYQSLDNGYGWLSKNPSKKRVIENAGIEGKVKILPNSYNRAVTIETETDIFLQSYDTLILKIAKNGGGIVKLWHGFSKTTLKHINEFMKPYGISYNKKEWLEA